MAGGGVGGGPVVERAETFGALLRRYREERGLSQNALAKKAGVNVGTVNRLESGERSPGGSEMVLALAGALELAPRERDLLLLAGGQFPGGVTPAVLADPALLVAADILGDETIPAEQRADFRAQIILAARRWRDVR
jgi:transcriptional regulator with XRE-family HTH domain